MASGGFSQVSAAILIIRTRCRHCREQEHCATPPLLTLPLGTFTAPRGQTGIDFFKFEYFRKRGRQTRPILHRAQTVLQLGYNLLTALLLSMPSVGYGWGILTSTNDQDGDNNAHNLTTKRAEDVTNKVVATTRTR